MCHSQIRGACRFEKKQAREGLSCTALSFSYCQMSKVKGAQKKKRDSKTRFICGATRARPSDGKCTQPVKEKGARCRYHDKSKLPYTDAVFSKDGPQLSVKAWDLVAGQAIEQRTLRVKLNTAHSKVENDTPGWIYVFYLKGDDSTTYFKVGCTSKPQVESRLAEWPGAVMRYAIRVPFHKLAEQLVFALLARWRLLRYVFKSDGKGVGNSGKQYITVYRSTGKVLKDRSYDRVVKAKKASDLGAFSEHAWKQLKKTDTPAFGTRKKEIEWFKAPFSKIETAMETVTEALIEWKTTAEKK
jgi:hypothetical protein